MHHNLQKSKRGGILRNRDGNESAAIGQYTPSVSSYVDKNRIEEFYNPRAPASLLDEQIAQRGFLTLPYLRSIYLANEAEEAEDHARVGRARRLRSVAQIDGFSEGSREAIEPSPRILDKCIEFT